VDNPAIQYMYNKGRRHHRPFRCSVRTLFYFPWQENKPPLAQMKERSGMIHPPKAVADKTAPDSLSHPLHSYVSEREGVALFTNSFPHPQAPTPRNQGRRATENNPRLWHHHSAQTSVGERENR
jgi:hypothetical protein